MCKEFKITNALCVCLLLGLMCVSFQACDAAPIALASARQFLPPIPGYIPVYIRQGDTPLEEINLDLAEAFRAHAAKYNHLSTASGRAQNAVHRPDAKEQKKEIEHEKPERVPVTKEEGHHHDHHGHHDHHHDHHHHIHSHHHESDKNSFIQKIKPKLN